MDHYTWQYNDCELALICLELEGTILPDSAEKKAAIKQLKCFGMYMR